tara:strand:- start:2114 stop:2260 length:147 start_codon:yes stop_codon:yes gene_type:complete
MESQVITSSAKPRCSECGSDQVYVRFKTLEKVCRHCGNIEKLEENKNG